jgi:hypothetical protein
MTRQVVSRRTMLKSILAAGGALGASAFLPEKWLKPLVRTGVLPVHAQTSGYLIRAYQGSGYIGAHVYTLVSDSLNVSEPMESPDKVSLPPSPGTPVSGVSVTASVTQNNGVTHISITSGNPQVTNVYGWAGFTIDPGDGGKLKFTATSGVSDELTINPS